MWYAGLVGLYSTLRRNLLLRRTTYLCYLLFLTFSLLLPTSTYAATHAPGVAHPSQASADFPVVDPLYIDNQLSYLTTNFQRREAGYITNQGHDRLAAYWTQEMVKNLQGFGPQVRRDTFSIPPWPHPLPTSPPFKTDATLPASTPPT